ncbi:MAG: matrixin family metalloprotease [Patescibacteria group bacterium]
MSVSRIIFVTSLLIIIIFCASFILFRYYGNQDNANWFNDNLRGELAKSPTLRSLYALNWDGDAKSDYLSNRKFKKLVIEIESIQQCALYFADNQALADQINDLIQKPEGVEIILNDSIDEDEIIFLESNPLDRAVSRLKARLQNHKTGGDTAFLHVLCLDYNRDASTTIGATYENTTVLLFYNRIKEVTEKNSAALPIYLKTTLLHEFGHQLGLPHLEDTGCMMAATVESPGNAIGALDQIPQSFCPASLNMIQTLRLQYQET